MVCEPMVKAGSAVGSVPRREALGPLLSFVSPLEAWNLNSALEEAPESMVAGKAGETVWAEGKTYWDVESRDLALEDDATRSLLFCDLVLDARVDLASGRPLPCLFKGELEPTSDEPLRLSGSEPEGVFLTPEGAAVLKCGSLVRACVLERGPSLIWTAGDGVDELVLYGRVTLPSRVFDSELVVVVPGLCFVLEVSASVWTESANASPAAKEAGTFRAAIAELVTFSRTSRALCHADSVAVDGTAVKKGL